MRSVEVCVALRRPLTSVIAGLAAGLMAATASSPASAQMFGWEDPPRYSKRAVRPMPRREFQRQEVQRHEEARSRDRHKAAEPKVPPQQMVYAVVSLADQHISVYGSEGLLTTSRVSTGQAGHRTPTGIFTILEKQRWHHSNIYSGAPMPFMQRITWSGVAMHEGVVPGYPASHGCIRLPAAFAAKIWEMTKVGLRVMVSPHDVAPVEFADARLPVPRLVPASDYPAPVAASETVRPAGVQLAAVGAAPAGEPPAQPSAPAAPRMLNPLEVAVAMKARATAAVTTSKKAAETALKTAREAAAEADAAAAELRKAKIALEDLKARSTPATDEEIATAQKRVEDAKAIDDEKSPRSYELARAAREAEQAIDKAQADIAEAARRQAPVSVVISKKEGSILVKQGKKPVYEGPVTIKDAAVPLGNHLYIATAAAEGGGLKWVALDAPWQAEQERSHRASGRKAKDRQPEPEAAPVKASTAKEALDRIEIPAEVTAQLSSLFWIGSSIVVTDKGLSNENGEHTDLIVAIP